MICKLLLLPRSQKRTLLKDAMTLYSWVIAAKLAAAAASFLA